MQRVVAFLVMAGALPSLALAAVGAGADETSFRITVQDLFPQRDDLDVGVTLLATAYWRLPAGPLVPGAAQPREVAPVQGPLEATVQYRLQRACCGQQWVQGSRVLHDLAPLGEADLEPLEVDDGRLLRLHLRGTLRSALRAEGGDVAPERLRFSAWAPQGVALAPDGGPGSQVELRARSTLDLAVTAVVDAADGPAEGTWEGQGPADAELRRTFPVEGGLAATKAVSSPPVAALVALLVAAARR